MNYFVLFSPLDLERIDGDKTTLEKTRERESAIEAGAARGALRVGIPSMLKGLSKMKIFSRIKFKLPKIRIRGRALGKVSDKLGHVVEVVDAFKSNPGSFVQNESLKDRVVGYLKKVGPSYLSAVILGIALFSFYDLAASTVNEKFTNKTLRKFNPVISGAVAGFGYGSIYYIWTNFVPKIINFVPYPPQRIYYTGTVFGTTMSHMTMFSVYEYTKLNSLNATESKVNDFLGVLCVVLAAIASGSAHEGVSILTKPLETMSLINSAKEENNNVSPVVKVFRNLPKPKIKELFSPSIIITSVVGFLAYEYTKEDIIE
jgi:hypothetical protein